MNGALEDASGTCTCLHQSMHSTPTVSTSQAVGGELSTPACVMCSLLRSISVPRTGYRVQLYTHLHTLKNKKSKKKGADRRSDEKRKRSLHREDAPINFVPAVRRGGAARSSSSCCASQLLEDCAGRFCVICRAGVAWPPEAGHRCLVDIQRDRTVCAGA